MTRLALALALTVGALVVQPTPADTGMAGAGIDGRPCSRAEEHSVIWTEGRSWRCRYEPTTDVFRWGPAAAVDTWELP